MLRTLAAQGEAYMDAEELAAALSRLQLGTRTYQSGSQMTPRWRKADSNLYGAFPVK
jgi:hypothetical protein